MDGHQLEPLVIDIPICFDQFALSSGKTKHKSFIGVIGFAKIYKH